MSPIVIFDHISTAECRYARAPVARYGTIGQGPRQQRLASLAYAALHSAIAELGQVHPWGQPRYIVSAGAMVTQSDRRGPNDPHVRGLAYDIDAIWWSAPGRRIVTLEAPDYWRDYIAIQCILARHCGTVLGYDYDPAHRDHWHCDVTRPVAFDAGSRMDVLLLQRGLREVWGHGDLAVDGKFGPATLAAWQGSDVARVIRVETLAKDWRDWLLDTARVGLEGLK